MNSASEPSKSLSIETYMFLYGVWYEAPEYEICAVWWSCFASACFGLDGSAFVADLPLLTRLRRRAMRIAFHKMLRLLHLVETPRLGGGVFSLVASCPSFTRLSCWGTWRPASLLAWPPKFACGAACVKTSVCSSGVCVNSAG